MTSQASCLQLLDPFAVGLQSNRTSVQRAERGAKVLTRGSQGAQHEQGPGEKTEPSQSHLSGIPPPARPRLQLGPAS